MKIISFIFNLIACVLMIMCVWHNDLQFCAIMAILFAIYYKID
jgi:hypothetical protein